MINQSGPEVDKLLIYENLEDLNFLEEKIRPTIPTFILYNFLIMFVPSFIKKKTCRLISLLGIRSILIRGSKQGIII